MKKPTSRIVKLTPELAEELLSRNPRNRAISNTNYRTIVRAIERGEWELNGEAIKLDADGLMLDGQHRCLAVIETGCTIETFLIEGLRTRAQETMDIGKSRSLANILSIRGEKSATRLAAIITRLYTLEHFGLWAACNNGGVDRVTIRERLDWFEKNPWVRDLLEPARAVQADAGYPGLALVAALMVTFSGIDAEDSDYFWGRLRDGVGLAQNNPIYVLRKSLRIIAEDVHGERSERYLSAITIKAWNAYRAGDPVGVLRYRTGGANPEKFPKAK